MPPLRVERLLPQWATARVAPTAFLCGDSERRVREAAPYKGRIPPERAGEDTRPYGGCGSVLSFRRGRTLAGPREGFCYFGTHPHPPRIRSALSPWKGEGFRAADSRQGGVVPKSGGRVRTPAPTADAEASCPFVGAGHWPARQMASAIPEPTLIRLAYARHLLTGREKAFGRLIAAPTNRGERS